MAGARAALGVLFSMALAAMAFPMGACLEIAQPSPENNILFFHYEPKNQTGWMSTDQNGIYCTSFSWSIMGCANIHTFIFPLKPGLDIHHNFVMNLGQCWTIQLHIQREPSGRTFPYQLNSTLTFGNYSISSEIRQEIGNFSTFAFWSDHDVILNEWNITFTLEIGTHHDKGPTNSRLNLITDGSSNLTMPILRMDSDTDDDGIINSRDPDDDNDGHNDTKDAYPMDPRKWQKPPPARGLLHWYDALAMVIMIGLLVASFDRHERLSRPLR